MKNGVKNKEQQFFAYVQMREKNTVRSGEIAAALKITAKQEQDLFNRLRSARKIAQVKRGLYLVPLKLPLGGIWSPDEALALKTLMDDCDGRYQLTGPNAFNRYGLVDQMPTRLYLYNNRISGEKTIGSISMTLIKVDDSRLGATEEFENRAGIPLIYSSRARTLMDAVYDWSRFNGLPRAFGWIRNELASRQVEAEELIEVTIKYGNRGTARRIGALLDKEGVKPQSLKRLKKSLSGSKSVIPLVPRRPRKGTALKDWGVIWNEEAS